MVVVAAAENQGDDIDFSPPHHLVLAARYPPPPLPVGNVGIIVDRKRECRVWWTSIAGFADTHFPYLLSRCPPCAMCVPLWGWGFTITEWGV